MAKAKNQTTTATSYVTNDVFQKQTKQIHTRLDEMVTKKEFQKEITNVHQRLDAMVTKKEFQKETKQIHARLDKIEGDMGGMVTKKDLQQELLKYATNQSLQEFRQEFHEFRDEMRQFRSDIFDRMDQMIVAWQECQLEHTAFHGRLNRHGVAISALQKINGLSDDQPI